MKVAAQIGRYKIERLLGAGANAEVYEAMDTVLNRPVALKVLKPKLIADEDAYARFIQEAQVAATVFHPHIATVVDLGEADGYYYLAMRYIEGESLDKVIASGPLPWAKALTITSQVADALQFAHAKGLVHRDVKPQNIIISEQDGAVLTDFGLVKAIQSSGLSSTGAMLGTPQYMAPEIWLEKGVSAATDQYALACVLVEMLTSKSPFEANTPPGVMARHFQPRQLQLRWPQGTPSQLPELLTRALDQEPAKRYASMADFVGELKAAGAAAPVSKRIATKRDQAKAAPETGQESSHPLPPSSPRQRKLTPWMIGGGVAALFAVAAVAGWMAHGRSGLSTPHSDAPGSFVMTIPASPISRPTAESTTSTGPPIEPAIVVPIQSIVPSPTAQIETASTAPGPTPTSALRPGTTILTYGQNAGYFYGTRRLGFFGQKGDILGISAVTKKENLPVDIALVDERGNVLATGGYQGFAWIDPYVLPYTGAYYVIVGGEAIQQGQGFMVYIRQETQ